MITRLEWREIVSAHNPGVTREILASIDECARLQRAQQMSDSKYIEIPMEEFQMHIGAAYLHGTRVALRFGVLCCTAGILWATFLAWLIR